MAVSSTQCKKCGVVLFKIESVRGEQSSLGGQSSRPPMGPNGTIAGYKPRATKTAPVFPIHPAIAPNLPHNRRDRVQSSGYSRWIEPDLELSLDHRPLFHAQLCVNFFHGILSPKNIALGI
jgi:hypothetical protein